MNLHVMKGADVHFAIEIGEQDGKCRECGEPTVLIAPWSEWRVDSPDKGEFDDKIEINEEVTAHYCTKCDIVTGFWINT